tara:strand:+ start:90 stop:242 length:153 start_codon:yes stop_codon:yes gene_type:complete
MVIYTSSAIPRHSAAINSIAKQKIPVSGEMPGINAGMHPRIRTNDLTTEM